MKFCERIKLLRKKKGLSQAKLANMVNLTQQTVGKWEKENALPGIETLLELAKKLNVSVDYLIGYTDTFAPASVKTNESEPFSAAESELIKKYRALPDEEQKRVKNFLDFTCKSCNSTDNTDSQDNNDSISPPDDDSVSPLYGEKVVGL